jgi:CheY-like chemotaxis protein
VSSTTARSTPPRRSTAHGHGRALCVLVVEDDPVIRGLLVDFLDMLGLTVYSAVNGKEALGKLKRARPDLILLDLMMPVMDGREFGLALRASAAHAHVPIVLMSASPEAAKVCVEIEARACLSKPFELDDLARQVERLH